MCVDQIVRGSPGVFDPTRCPLLQGLTTEEADRLMAVDPRILACRSAVAKGDTADLDPCVAKMVDAYEKRAEPRRRGPGRAA